jgi:hypothetical protein
LLGWAFVGIRCTRAICTRRSFILVSHVHEAWRLECFNCIALQSSRYVCCLFGILVACPCANIFNFLSLGSRRLVHTEPTLLLVTRSRPELSMLLTRIDTLVMESSIDTILVVLPNAKSSRTLFRFPATGWLHVQPILVLHLTTQLRNSPPIGVRLSHEALLPVCNYSFRPGR